MELLLKLKQDILASSRFNVGNIIIDKVAKEYWETHFGSEKLSVPFTIFIQVLEEQNGRMRPQQVELFRLLLDANKDDKVTAYEYIAWLQCFGNDVDTVVVNTFNSLLNLETGAMYDWFHVNIFKEQAIKKLSKGGFGSMLMRFSDIIGIFVVYCVGVDGAICEFQLKSVDGLYRLLKKREVNTTEDLIFPYLECRGNKKKKNFIYFSTLTVFMWHLEDICKIISMKLDIRFEPIDWKTGEIEEKHKPKNNRWRHKIFTSTEEYYKNKLYGSENNMPKLYETWQKEIKDVEFKSSLSKSQWVETTEIMREEEVSICVKDDNYFK